jgi:hypothetical protein
VTFDTDFRASTRLSALSRRFNPARGLNRAKSGRNAREFSRTRVWTTTVATPASIAAITNGAEPRSQIRPARRNALPSFASNWCARARNGVRPNATSRAAPGAAHIRASVTAAKPARVTSSREMGTCPCSRARC